MAQAISFEKKDGTGFYLYPCPYIVHSVTASARSVYKKQFAYSNNASHFLQDNELTIRGQITKDNQIFSGSGTVPNDRFQQIYASGKKLVENLFYSTQRIIIQSTSTGTEGIRLEEVNLKSFNFDSQRGANFSSYTATFGYGYQSAGSGVSGSGILQLSNYSVSENVEFLEGFAAAKISGVAITAPLSRTSRHSAFDTSVYRLTLTETATAHPSQSRSEDLVKVAKDILQYQSQFSASNMYSIFFNSGISSVHSRLINPTFSYSANSEQGSYTRVSTFDVIPFNGSVSGNCIYKIDRQISRSNTDISSANIEAIFRSTGVLTNENIPYILHNFVRPYAFYALSGDYVNARGIADPYPFNIILDSFSHSTNRSKSYIEDNSVTPYNSHIIDDKFSAQYTESKVERDFTAYSLLDINSFDINVSDTESGDLFSEVLTIGGATTYLFDSYARSELKRSVEVNFSMSESSTQSFPSNFANAVLALYSPLSSSGVTKCFVNPITQSYNPKQLTGSFSIEWVYEK